MECTLKSKSFFSSETEKRTPLKSVSLKAVHISLWPFEAWSDGVKNYSVWEKHPQFNTHPKIDVPEVETIKLFEYGNRWSTYVLDKSHVEMIKEALGNTNLLSSSNTMTRTSGT